jgi:hypothetical protein
MVQCLDQPGAGDLIVLLRIPDPAIWGTLDDSKRRFGLITEGAIGRLEICHG